jgi:hypothetical protein
MALWESPTLTGGWLYTRQGNLVLSDAGGMSAVVLLKVHWNWRQLTRQGSAALTGKGIRRASAEMTEAKLVWVMGDQIIAHYEFPSDEIKGESRVNTNSIAHSPQPTAGTEGEVFSIRCIGGVKGSVGFDKALPGGAFGGGYLVFEITDVQNGRRGKYNFYGPEQGIGISFSQIKLPPPIGLPSLIPLNPATGARTSNTLVGTGKSTVFQTSRPQKLEDFSGEATLMNSSAKIGLFGKSFNGLGFINPRLAALPGCNTTVIKGEDNTDILRVDVPSVSGVRINIFSAMKGPFQLSSVDSKP